MSYLISAVGEMEGQELRFYLAMRDKIHFWTVNSQHAMQFEDEYETEKFIEEHYNDFLADEYIKLPSICIGQLEFEEYRHLGEVNKDDVLDIITVLFKKHDISLNTCINEDLDDIYYDYDEQSFELEFICEETSDYFLTFNILFDGTKKDLINKLMKYFIGFNPEMYAAITYMGRGGEITLQECLDAGKHFQQVLLNAVETLKNI